MLFNCCGICSATHKDEELFEKISLGKYEYISPFWNGISDSVKVRNACTDACTNTNSNNNNYNIFNRWVMQLNDNYD